MNLKEKECSKCPQCNELYFDNLGIKSKLCTSCKIPTERASYFTRLRLERFAFIYTLSLIASVCLLFGIKWQTLKVGPGFVVFLFLIVIPVLLFLIYHMMNEYLSGTNKAKKELNIFKEIYLSDNKPTETELAFSWPKYFKEAVHFVGIFIIFAFLGAGIILVGNLIRK